MQRGKLKLKRLLHRSAEKIKAARQRVFVRALVGSLVVLMAVTAMSVLLMSDGTVAAPLENEYLFNIPYTYIPPRTPADMDWTKKVDHVGYDFAYTDGPGGTSAEFNGTATPNHVVINDKSITFCGYDVEPYIDYCFTDAYPTLTSINITMRPMQMIFHTFYQTAFLFNGIMEVSGPISYYTGYAVLLECSNSEGMLESGTATLKLVYMDHEEFETNGPPDRKSAEKSTLKKYTLLATLRSGIQNRPTSLDFRITLDVDPDTRAFRLYIDGELRARVAAEDVKSGADSVGLGFFTGYYKHNCDILTVVRYDELNLEFAPMDPPMSTATLRFMLDTGSTVLRDPETTVGYTALQYYRAEQPPELQINGETYYLVDSNMLSLGYPLDRDIVRRYETTAVNSNANTIILYYSKDPPNVLGNKPRKLGRVTDLLSNVGDWKTGSPELPVPVDGNYDLEYNVVSGPKPMTPDESDHLPVLAQGNASATTNTTWMKQPQTESPVPNITKNNVVTINTVSLEQNYPDIDAFNAEVTEWRGEEIIKAWDATYSPNDPPMNNLIRTAQWAQTIPYNTYDYTTIIPYLDSLNVTNLNIAGGVSTNPYSSTTDYLAIYRLTLLNNTMPDEISWYGRNESNSNPNMVMLYTGGTWEEIAQVSSTTYTNYTWTLTPSQKAGLSGNTIHIAFFSVKNGSYSGLYNASAEPFSLGYPASSGPTQPEPIERCYIWLTERTESTSVTKRYNMYIGGKGGVQLAENAALQFANFGALTTINFSKLHTDNTLSMAYMFMSCTGLTKLDVSWFYTLNAQNMSGMFYGCSYLTSVDVKYFDTRNVTNMGAMFYGCNRLTSLALRGWDTAKVLDMGQMFYNCSALTSLDLRAFDTGLVQNMNSMFYSCTGLTSLDISTFNTENVTNMGYMFYNCYRLTNTSLNVTHFDTANVTQMAFMFANCFSYSSSTLNTLDCSSFDTSNPGLVSLESMFQGCTYLRELNVSSFETQNIEIFTSMFSGCQNLQTLDVTNFDTSSAVNMYAMFMNCRTLTALDVTNFNTEHVINMNYMFYYCYNLRSAAPYNFNVLNFDTSSCKTMYGMFYYCYNLTNLDLRSFNTTNVQGIGTSPTASLVDNFCGMAYMFYNCYRLETLDVSSFDTTNVGTMASMFASISTASSPGSLTLDLRNFNTVNVKNMSSMFSGNNKTTLGAEFNPSKLLISTWDTSGVTDMSSMFSSCTGFTGNEFDALLAHFNTSSVINMASMFSGCTRITSIALTGFDTSSVAGTSNSTGMALMFYNCIALTSVDLSSFDTSHVYSFYSMFDGCKDLTTTGLAPSLAYFNTVSSRSFEAMFQNCSSLTGTLDLRNFSTGNASSFSGMFNGCTNLQGINLRSFNTANATTFASMFRDCAALTALDLRSFNTENAYYFNNMFQGCTLLAAIDLSSFNTIRATTSKTFAAMFKDCPALTSLDLSTFTTTYASSFSEMFSGCTGLTTLNLSNFDTGYATNFYRMFYNCSSLTAINGISHFNTARVTDMREMFYGCRLLSSLDIRWWETPALLYLGEMFNTDPDGLGSSLTTVHLESMDFVKINAISPAYTYSVGKMFYNVNPNTGVDIYVGTIDMMTWFDNAEPNIDQTAMDLVTRHLVDPWPGANVNPGPTTPTAAVVLPVDYQAPPGNETPTPTTPATPPPVVQPQPPSITPITPPTPANPGQPDPNPPKTITDTIPEGLQIISVSGGGVQSGLDLHDITWTVDSFTFDFYIMTKVTPRVDDDGFMYENFATVHIGPDEDTNHTYHSYGLYWLVTEQYYYFDDDGAHTRIASNNAFNNGFPVVVRNGKNFDLNQTHIPEELYGLYYYGYQYIDDATNTPIGSVVLGPPPEPPAMIFSNVQENKRIRYYYRSFPIAVYVHFVDASGNEIQETVVWAANKGNNYYLPVSYLDPITFNAALYNYYGYKLTEPTDGPPVPRGTQPDYSILNTTGAPQFANIQEDKHLTLYFDVAPIVTVYFLDDYKPSNVIKGSLSYFVTNGSTFTPASGLFDDIISAGNTYEYADNWSFDDGARVTSPSMPAPFTVTGNVDLNLFFKTNYNILEKFHKDTEPRYDHLHNRLPPDELSPDVLRERLPAGTPYTGEPPTVLVDGSDVWSYIGYKLNDDANVIYLGIPEVVGLEEHLCIIFVYEKTPTAPAIQKQSSVPTETALIPGEEFTYTISVEYPSAKSGTMVFEDLLPEGLQFVSSDPPAATTNVGGRTKVTASVSLVNNQAQLEITVRVVAEEAVFRNYADVTDPSSEVYRTNTVINHSGGALDSITIEKSASPASGTEDAPAIVAKDSEITYTITVTNDNEGRGPNVVITDVLPLGLVCTDTEDGGVYTNLNRTVTWNVSQLPNGVSTYSFTARAEEAVIYENTATMYLLGVDIETNSTWHAVATPIPAELNIPVKKAFLNDAEEFDNGSAEDPVVVRLGETLKYTIEFEKPALLTVANPTFKPQATPPEKIEFENGSFELPVIGSIPGVNNNAMGGYNGIGNPSWGAYWQEDVPGWNTRPTYPDSLGVYGEYANSIEVQLPNGGVGYATSCPDGNQYAELNSYVEGTLYQNCTTVPGTKVYYEFWHTAKRVGVSNGPDVMNFYLRAADETTGGLQRVCSDSYPTWGHYTGSYMVPIGQTLTEFSFESVSTTHNDKTLGNYLDGIRLFTSSYIELTKSNDAPLVAGVQTADAGSTVTYTIEVQNTGESDADNVVIRDILPAGASLVAGSVKIDGTATSNYTYNAVTRMLKLHVGAGATSSQGGMVAGDGSFSEDCENLYTVTFEVYVDGRVIAQNRKYENQAKVNYTDRYDEEEYLFTNYSNVDEFVPGKGLRDIITDKVPTGLTVDTGSIKVNDNLDGAYNAVTHTVTWDIYNKTPGAITLSFEVTVTDTSEDGLYVNRALVGTEPTNRTYHELLIPEPVKTARVSSDGGATWVDSNDGTEEEPTEVKPGDQIEYTIDLYNPATAGAVSDAVYDIVFALDWSGSMGRNSLGYMLNGTDGVPQQARLYARNIIMDMSEHIFANYPGSKISLMGCNLAGVTSPSGSNTSSRDAGWLCIQVDTPFVGPESYESVVQATFAQDPLFISDDNAMFLRAAIDKMSGNQGITPVQYGGYLPTDLRASIAGVPVGEPAYVIPRDTSDPSRIPVIVMIADFHYYDSDNFFQYVLQPQAARFHALYPDGRLLVIRTDHAENDASIERSGPPADWRMTKFLSPQTVAAPPDGRANWAFAKIGYAEAYMTALSKITSLFEEIVPPTALGGTLTDQIPEGLELIPGSISDDGVYDEITRTITWDLMELPIGETSVSFKTTVKNAGVYANTAYQNGVPSNTTWHQMLQYSLHIRQLVINPISPLSRPVMGYYTLLNDGMTLPLTSDSVTPGYPFTEYTLIPGEDPIYTLTDIVPQYYEFAGHKQNDGPSAVGHPVTNLVGAVLPGPGTAANGSIELDYSATGEIWITVYITPKGSPGNQQTGVETNRFGTVYPPAPLVVTGNCVMAGYSTANVIGSAYANIPGTVTETGVIYAKDDPSLEGSVSSASVTSAFATPYDTMLTGISNGMWYYRAFVKNGAGTTFYGDIKSYDHQIIIT